MRQSDAVFFHTKQLPEVIGDLFSQNPKVKANIHAVGVSSRPRNLEGSYMPCFYAGVSVAVGIAETAGIKLFETSHQVGHILAAAVGSLSDSGDNHTTARKKLSLIKKPFIAFHVSGGTTDCLYVTPHDSEIIKCSAICQSADLKAGQAVDRVGVMLGLKFPCGKALEQLAMNSDKRYKINVKLKDGNAHFSGLENKCRRMLSEGENPCDIARYCLSYIATAVVRMTEFALSQYNECLPLLYCGGVMSNKFIRDILTERFGIDNTIFCPPEFSSDNAVGTAVYAYLKSEIRQPPKTD
jgi:N6-L-threonylcarbamoyladenine synthase